MIRVEETPLDGVRLIHTRIFQDERGHFRELWNEARYAEAGVADRFVQDNVSVSRGGVIRGLHYQHPNGQAKLVSVLEGEIWDVAVDIRRGSPTFGRWYGATLSAECGRQLLIPIGFAHGFAVTSQRAVVSYKCSAMYDAASESTVRWDDPTLGIDWPVREPLLSDRDRGAAFLAKLAEGTLPPFEGSSPRS